MTEKYISSAKTALFNGDYKSCHEYCMQALRLNPNISDIYFLLAIIAADHSNIVKGYELIERAIDLNPLMASYHAQKARIALMKSDRISAIEAVNKALKLEPNDQHTFDTLGVVLSRSGQHANALPLYKKAIAMGSASIDILYNYASALQFTGALDEARKIFSNIIQKQPDHYKSWSSLIHISKQSRDHNHIETLQKLFEKHKANADAALNIGHALAKSYEDIGEHSKTMEFLAKAKAIKKQSIDYDYSHDRKIFDAAQSLPALFNIRATTVQSQSPIFVVGMPRTGTTLVDRILSSHDNVTSVGELSDFGLQLKYSAKTASPYVLDAQTLLKSADIDLAHVGADYLNYVRQSFPNLQRTLDKMPLNFFLVPQIAKAIPDARIICLKRGAADTILSNYRQLFATSFSYYNYAYDIEDTARYYLRFRALMNHYEKNIDPKIFMQIKYEDLVDDLEPQARKLIEFAGLEWQDQCLNFHENSAPVATASSAQVRSPIYSSSLGRWRKYEAQMRPALKILEQADCPPD